MFGSQALETAIGLATMFFILATAASAITEVVARILKKRARDLERGIAGLLHGRRPKPEDMDAALAPIKQTSVWRAAESGAGRSIFGGCKGPSYLSAKMFADMISELQHTAGKESASALDALPNLQARMNAMLAEGRQGVLAHKAGLESWFDEAMARVEGAYKRWVTSVLFAIGLIIAVGGNVSTVTAAQQLWQDPLTRATVTEAAGKLLQDGASEQQLDAVADAADNLDALGLPVGWDADSRAVWTAGGLSQGMLADVAGWLLTAVLIMLGAPFWFDLLSRLSTLRGAGAKPALAVQDDASATSRLTAAAKASPIGLVLGQDAGTSAESVGPQPEPGLRQRHREPDEARDLGVQPNR